MTTLSDSLMSLAPQFVERMGWLLVLSSWQFLAIAALAWIMQRLLARQAATTRYALLISAMLLMLFTSVVTWSLLPGSNFGRHVDDVAAMAAADSPEAVTAASTTTPPPVSQLSGTIQPSGSAANDRGHALAFRNAGRANAHGAWWHVAGEMLRPWLAVIVAMWSAGVLAFSARPLLSWYTIRRFGRVGVSSAGEAIEKMLHRLQQQLGIRRSVRVLQSTLVSSPMVMGCLRSLILVPSSLISGLPSSQLEALLAHELAHVRRYDYLVNVAQTLFETLFFYHPAVWWISRQIRTERENCCDDLVVATLGDRVQYGRALLAIETHRGATNALALGARGGSLLARVRRLLSADPCVRRRSTAGIAVLSLLMVCIIGALVWATVSPPAKSDDISGEATSDVQAQPTSAADAVNNMRVRVVDASNDAPIAGVDIRAENRDAANKQAPVVATTDADGVAEFSGLANAFHRFFVTSNTERPYMAKNVGVQVGERDELLIRLQPACELVLRAVDADTGQGIPGVKFGRERMLAELWMQVVVPDNLGAKRPVRYEFDDDPPNFPPESDYETDADGYYRCLVGPATWSYMVYQHPAGYERIVPINGRQEVEIETPAGKRVEYTFRLVRGAAVPQEPAAKQETRRWRFRVLNGDGDDIVANINVRVAPWAKGHDPQERFDAVGSPDGWLEIELSDPGGAFIEVRDPRFFDCRIEGLKPQEEPKNRLGVVLWSNDHVFEPLEENTAPVLRCWEGSRFVGQILQANGTPAANVKLNIGARVTHVPWMNRLGIPVMFVSWDHGQWPNWSTTITTDEQGRFATRVPPAEGLSYVRVGSATLSFVAVNDTAERAADPNSALLAHVPFMVEMEVGTQHENTFDAGVIRLEVGVELRGQVVRADGTPAAGVQVWAEPVVNIPRDAYEFSPHAGRYMLTDEQGRFAFAPLRAGPVKISIHDKPRNDQGEPTAANFSEQQLVAEVMLPEGTEPRVKELKLRIAN